MKTEKKLSDLKMRPDFSSRIPPLLMEELEQLEENILAEGCVINPIVVCLTSLPHGTHLAPPSGNSCWAVPCF